MYNESDPNIDPQERNEEMERMREHVLKNVRIFSICSVHFEGILENVFYHLTNNVFEYDVSESCLMFSCCFMIINDVFFIDGYG